MHLALTRFMTGPSREAERGDTPIERRGSPAPGYATFDNLLTAIGQLQGTIRDEMRELRRSMEADNTAIRAVVDTYRAETNRRLDALEHWRDEQEVADAVRQGRIAMFLLAFRWLTQHWQVIWAVVALVLGLTWTFAGQPPVGVGPVQVPSPEPGP